MSQLTDTLALFYVMQDADRDKLEGQLLQQRKDAWTQALAELGKRHGCTGAPNAPSGDDLTELKARAREDAQSIADTWNKDLRTQVEKLYDNNPKGNRTYYAANLERWANERQVWKMNAIALNQVQATRFYAQQTFVQANGLKPRYMFAGGPAVCRQCLELYAAGVVEQRFVDSNPCPVHVSCPHEWVEVKPEQIPCEQMWMG